MKLAHPRRPLAGFVPATVPRRALCKNPSSCLSGPLPTYAHFPPIRSAHHNPNEPIKIAHAPACSALWLAVHVQPRDHHRPGSRHRAKSHVLEPSLIKSKIRPPCDSPAIKGGREGPTFILSEDGHQPVHQHSTSLTQNVSWR
jgi:hypothetical protein